MSDFDNNIPGAAWLEYDAAADWCAARGIKGTIKDPLPENLSDRAMELINIDPEAFEGRVQDMAYARAMKDAHAAGRASRDADIKELVDTCRAVVRELVKAANAMLTQSGRTKAVPNLYFEALRRNPAPPLPHEGERMRSTPSECRCCSAYLEYGGRLCQQCREELSSDLYDVPKLLASHNAVRGIPDPAAAIKAAREAMEFAKGELFCDPHVSCDPDDPECMCGPCTAVHKLCHALSLLTPSS